MFIESARSAEVDTDPSVSWPPINDCSEHGFVRERSKGGVSQVMTQWVTRLIGAQTGNGVTHRYHQHLVVE